MTNCKNCGAPLRHKKCEYCGTIYEGFVRDDVYGYCKGNEIRVYEFLPKTTDDRLWALCDGNIYENKGGEWQKKMTETELLCDPYFRHRKSSVMRDAKGRLL